MRRAGLLPPLRTPKMVTTSRYLEAPQRLRAFVRAHETSLVVLAALIGMVGGLVVAGDERGGGRASRCLVRHSIRAAFEPDQYRPLRALLVPSLGGLLLGLAFLLLPRWRPAREIDPIEANALHGGRMSLRGSVIVALQTVWSSGVGASVGLEAGYTQLASGLAASLGRGVSPAPRRPAHHGRLRRRRGDRGRVRGAAGRRLLCLRADDRRLHAGQPAPVGVAAVAGYFVAHGFGALSLGIRVGPRRRRARARPCASPRCSGCSRRCSASCIMRGVALCESAAVPKTGCGRRCARRSAASSSALLALLTPQVMSSGHGALHFAGMCRCRWRSSLACSSCKAMASIISLG